MESAAYNGHLKVVQFLNKNRREVCTKRGIKNAIRFGHVHVLRWLFENRAERVTVGTFWSVAILAARRKYCQACLRMNGGQTVDLDLSFTTTYWNIFCSCPNSQNG